MKAIQTTSVQVFVLGNPNCSLYHKDLWFHSEEEAEVYIKALNFFFDSDEIIIIPVTVSVPTKFLSFFT